MATLSDPSDKKFIVIHLLGTHGQYRFRYPSEYSIFNNAHAVSKFSLLSQENLDYYNQYDNAVLYNDYVLYNIIDIFKKSNNYGALVYFSDHGEEVFDVKNFHGRNELDPTQAMYDIPFLLWASEDYKSKYSFWQNKHILNKKCSNIDFAHTLCELTHINYKFCNYNQSIINDNLIYKPRLIGDLRYKPIDYDRYFA